MLCLMQLIRFIVLKPSAYVKSVFYRGICYGKRCGKPLMVYHLQIIILLMYLSYVVINTYSMAIYVILHS